MLAANGLYGHIQRNAVKSVLLLCGFVVFAALFWYAWCIVYTAIVDVWWQHRFMRVHTPVTVGYIFDHAGTRAVERWYVPLVFSAAWFLVAYMIHADMIRAATGARPVTRIDEPRLYKIVERLAIGAGLPMPRIEVMRTDALNAYAAGLDEKDAVIAVTRGLLQALNDDELEAVLAHEMTHIKNADVSLMVIATVFAGGLTLLGDGLAQMLTSSAADPSTASQLATSSWRGRRGGGGERDDGSLVPILISLAVAIVFMALTHVFALIIKFALSRAREYMADAGAVELTKNPDALISALRKISENDEVPGVSGNMQAMMISASIDGLFATHPAIDDRISALRLYAGARDTQRTPRPARVARPLSAAMPADAPSMSGLAGAQPAGAMGFAGSTRPTFGRRRAAG